VICREDGIRIEVMKSFVGKHVDGKRITLLDSECVFESNSTHLYIETKLNECGTKSNFALTSVIYSNIIRTKVDPNAIIVRNKDSVQIPVECFYSITQKGSNRVHIASRGEFGDRVEERLRGNGVGVRIKEDVLRNSRSIELDEIKVDINPDAKYLVELRTKPVKSSRKIQFIPNFCYATPVQRGDRWMRYTLIEDG